MALTAGTRLGPYEITGPLGSGGMGEVYCALDTNLGRQLFFLAADGKMMSAVVREMGDKQVSFDNEPPEALFDSRIATAVFTRAFQYDVTKDGQRFVVTTTDAITSRAVPPLDVLVNWQSMLRN